ncbi:hypothetical protein KUTG_00285 [Kutzneria sp. 744]|nr:hypothetical protein KUTG_00285 [Kutzneria sp. 744]
MLLGREHGNLVGGQPMGLAVEMQDPPGPGRGAGAVGDHDERAGTVPEGPFRDLLGGRRLPLLHNVYLQT